MRSLCVSIIWIVVMMLPRPSTAQREVDVLIQKGRAFYNAGTYDSAGFYLQSAISACTACNDSMVGELYRQLGRTLQLQQEFPEALTAFHSAEQLLEKTASPDDEMELYLNMAEFFRAIMDYSKSQAYLNEAKKILDGYPIRDSVLLALYYNRAAALAAEANLGTNRVIYYSKEVLKLSEKIDIKRLKASSLMEMGLAYENLGQKNGTPSDFITAKEYYLYASHIFETTRQHNELAHAHMNIARCYARLHKMERAIEYLLLAEESAEEHNNLDLKPDVYESLSVCYESIGDYRSSLLYARKCLQAEIAEMDKKYARNLLQISKEHDVERQKLQTEREQERAEHAETISDRRTSERNQIILVALTFFIALIMSSVLYLKNRRINKQLGEKNIALDVSLKQKESLFKEMNHRVKNNLTLLQSLLHLRADASDNTETKQVLRESQNRIQSIATVHQLLYDIESTSVVSLKQYLQKIGDQLNRSSEKIRFELSGNDFELDISKAIQVGLIINELITNSIKYGIVAEQKLIINTSILSKGNSCDITYRDNGPGLPQGLHIESGGGFGFGLMRTLTEQLDTVIKYRTTAQGPVFSFSIKNPR